MRLRIIDPPLCLVGVPREAHGDVTRVLTSLPRRLGASVVLAAHIALDLQELARVCVLPVLEAEERDRFVSSRVYVAPPDYHLLVDGGRAAFSTEPEVKGARPSIDVLFESAVERRSAPVVGVLLGGGESDDGAAGLDALHCAGAPTIVTSGLAAGRTRHEPTHVVPAVGVAPLLVELFGGRREGPSRAQSAGGPMAEERPSK